MNKCKVKALEPITAYGVVSFRVYLDGTVVHQDDFAEYDCDPQANDYDLFVVPEVIVDSIYEQGVQDEARDNWIYYGQED